MKNADKPIYPTTESNYSDQPHLVDPSIGLTKREYFAGLAMQGLLAKIKFDDTKKDMNDKVLDRMDRFFESISRDSVRHADALLSALSPTNKEKRK